MFVIVTILEITAVALVICGFIFEKRVIAFEERIENRIAFEIAKVIKKFIAKREVK